MGTTNMRPRNDWMLKHLNWTLVLFFLLIYPVFIITFILVETTGNEDWFYLMFLDLPWIAGIWYLLVWNLKHKGRSLWNLLYLLLPFGAIVFLCVRNQEQLAKEKAEMEERQ